MSPAGMSLTKLSLAGKKLNYSRPGRVWSVTSRLGTGKRLTLFYSAVIRKYFFVNFTGLFSRYYPNFFGWWSSASLSHFHPWIANLILQYFWSQTKILQKARIFYQKIINFREIITFEQWNDV
jgi:hypothetical protein